MAACANGTGLFAISTADVGLNPGINSGSGGGGLVISF